jgi:hypothetical protein
MIGIPILACLAVIGWEDGLGAMHFAEATVALLMCAGVAFLCSLKSKIWLLIAYAVGASQLIFLVFYSYGSAWRQWLHTPRDWVILLYVLGLTTGCGVWIAKLAAEPCVLAGGKRSR